ncbi:hypothetical protein RUM43_000480 [Polyplax serrata]|uniref:Uncharacterized protein n=1 Tax=Polyplax serrata TaxID=468196 RepID=A0AAN8XN68_POLSC
MYNELGGNKTLDKVSENQTMRDEERDVCAAGREPQDQLQGEVEEEEEEEENSHLNSCGGAEVPGEEKNKRGTHLISSSSLVDTVRCSMAVEEERKKGRKRKMMMRTHRTFKATKLNDYGDDLLSPPKDIS